MRVERAALVSSGVQIENAAGLHGKLGIAGADPRAVLPRPDGILVQPPPHGLLADSGDNATALRLAHDVGGAQARERQAARRGQLTREGPDLQAHIVLLRRLPRCSNATHDLRLDETSPHNFVGQAFIDAVGHCASLGC